MNTIKEDSNNDITGEYIDGLSAIIQLARSRMESQTGEMIFNINGGMPNDDVAWNNTNLGLYNFYAIQNISAIDGVKSVNFSSSVVGDTIKYTAVISTIYGSRSINGEV